MVSCRRLKNADTRDGRQKSWRQPQLMDYVFLEFSGMPNFETARPTWQLNTESVYVSVGTAVVLTAAYLATNVAFRD